MMKSWRVWCVCCAVLAVCVAATNVRAAAPAKPKAPTVKVCGLRIVDDGYAGIKDGVRPFDWDKGITLVLLVLMPEGGIVELNNGASKLDKLTDDKGTNLLIGDSKGGRAGIGARPGRPRVISKDGKACIAELNGKSLPIKGATHVLASGTLVLNCADRKETIQHKNIALKKGTKLPGDIPFTISNVGKPDWGNDALQITLAAQQDLASIAEIKFFDAQGKEIKSRRAGTASTRSGTAVSVWRNFNLKKKVDVVTIAITYWTDMRIVKVPFNVKTSVGM